MSSPQFTLYGHTGGPNPWKVIHILNELELPFKLISLDFNKQEHKAESYTLINPNGRVPALIDHGNNDYTIWESGAIIFYLVEKYDKSNRLKTGNFEKDMQATQYLMFQMSGFGPYLGQAMWFTHFHSERIPSATERYNNEVLRVFGVMDGILKGGKKYLVDDRVTYADLSFVSWNMLVLNSIPAIKKAVVEEGKFPDFKRWHDSLVARDSVQKALKLQDQEKAKEAAK